MGYIFTGQGGTTARSGRFTSADTIIPEDIQGTQAWDRYAGMNNNPILYNDPSGHHVVPPREPQKTYPPSFGGYQIQATVAIGMPADAHRPVSGEKVSPLLFYGLALVVDDYGGVQIYGLTRAIEFNPILEQSPAELANPTDLLAFGATLAVGSIDGEGFTLEGTEAYEGYASDTVLGFEFLSVDWYEAVDPVTGMPDPEYMTGWDIGYSWGAPLSVGKVTTRAHPLTKRFGPTINPE